MLKIRGKLGIRRSRDEKAKRKRRNFPSTYDGRRGSVVVDTSLPPEQRMMDYLEKIKNPYCFRCGDAVVSIHFADKGNSLDSLLKNYFLGLKRS